MNFLDVILDEKRIEVKDLEKKRKPSLYKHLKERSNLGIIAEIKRHSPSKGWLLNELNVEERGKSYEQYGASCISVLTDKRFFKGSFQDLQRVSRAVSIPVLCKDFIISKIQIDLAKSHGASVILLILAALSDQDYYNLYSYAEGLGLEILVEVHNEEELLRALSVKPKLIGINNRNLKTFKVDLNVTRELVNKYQIQYPDILFISESGVSTQEDALLLKESGVKGLLVGETLMKAKNYGPVLRSLQL